MTTGERIKSARKAAKITQAELGARLGIAYQTVAQWENGLRQPKYETLQKIAAALETSVLDLVVLSQEERETYAYIQKRLLDDGMSPDEAQRQIISEKLSSETTDMFLDAEAAADAATVKCYADVPDQQLKTILLEVFSHLNRRGRIAAVERLAELDEIARYKG